MVDKVGLISDIERVLQYKTSQKWCVCAKNNCETLLQDHAQNERNAAFNALSLMHRFTFSTQETLQFSRLAREELIHHEQVLTLMKRRNISPVMLKSSRYGAAMKSVMRDGAQDRLVDHLLIAAIIEARSCERFHALIPHLDDELASFYEDLFVAEARHFHLFVDCAKRLTSNATDRLTELVGHENSILQQEESIFRFHSGIPDQALLATIPAHP